MYEFIGNVLGRIVAFTDVMEKTLGWLPSVSLVLFVLIAISYFIVKKFRKITRWILLILINLIGLAFVLLINIMDGMSKQW